MNIETALLLILPIILGFVGERYKDMSTLKYFIFISFALILAFTIIIIIDGGFFVPIKFALILSLSTIIFTTLLFHLQKKYRKTK